VNILFVNYGDFTTNSLNHIGGFAHWLSAHGHACAVAVPDKKETLPVVRDPRFLAATYAEVLARPAFFPDGRPADLIHAWTPREGVRKFVLAYQRLHPGTRLIIHLEDNEEYLLAAFAGRPLAELAGLPDDELAARLGEALPHPRRYQDFLRLADGVTVIVDRLREFVPARMPVQLLPPGVDFSLYHPQPAGAELRRDLGLRPEERVVVFTGSTTFANAAEIGELVGAVHLLNQGGTPVRLVRTGFHPPEFTDRYACDWRAFTLDLGFRPKDRLPALLALADVLVQPGQPGVFNDYRLPSKLPEFLAAGRPVILPAANLAAGLRDGTDALLLHTGTAGEIAGLCRKVLADPDLAAQLGKNAAAFARRSFDLATHAGALAGFYRTVAAAPARTDWTALTAGAVTETALQPAALARELAALLPADAPQRADLLARLAGLGRDIARIEVASARGLAATLQGRLEQEISRLQALVALTEKHAANLTQELHETRHGFDELKAWADQRTHELEDMVAAQRRSVFNFQAELVRATAEAAGERERLLADLAARQDKIRRMQASFSWQATAPLRALRRQLLKPAPAAPAAPAAPPPAPMPVAAAPRFQIDEPKFWQVPAGPLAICGWCLLADGTAPAKIRVHLGERAHFGLVGRPRPDVAAVHGSGPGAASGFQIDLMPEPGRHALHLEAADGHGAWQTLLRTEVTVFTPAAAPVVASYEQWLHLYEPVTPPALRELAARIAALPARPLISVLLPVYNAPEAWLRRAIESVREQVYAEWELCIADDASPAAHVRPLLEEAARSDSRIRVVFRETNGHISRASNSALDLARGEFIALLDHDDELAPHALAEVALALAARPGTDVLYSDEDKIDEHGRRFAPYFKPDFLPDLFLGQNYLTHLAVYRTTLVRDAGGFRPGFEGSQDWDLALRVVEKCGAGRVGHVPAILYHWRAIPGSTALAIDQKDYHAAAARRALEEHFLRTGRNAAITPVPGEHWRITHPLPSPPPLVSIIIPTRNGVRHLRRCLDSLRGKTTYARYEIIVVDNGSDDPATLDYLREFAAGGGRVLSWPHPFNYSALNNFAAGHAGGEILALLNDDLEVITPGWLEEMAAHALRPEIGCVGGLLYYPDDLIQHAGVVLGVGGVAGHAFKAFPRGTEGVFNRARLVQNYSAVTAACLVVRTATYRQVGGLDEHTLAIAFNDVDFCLKVRAAGYRNLWTPFAEFYHHESATRGAEDTPAKQARFRLEIETMRARWGGLLDADPAYNPNLSLASEDFALASPPRNRAAGPPLPSTP